MAAFQYGLNFNKKLLTLTPIKNYIIPCETLQSIQPKCKIIKPSKNFGLDIIYIPENHIGKIIGPNGKNITNIRKLTKAQIKINNSINKFKTRQITIIGNEFQIKNAINLIHNYIKDKK